MGSFGMIVGAFAAIFLKNPKLVDGKEEEPPAAPSSPKQWTQQVEEEVDEKNIFQKLTSSFVDVVKNKTTKYILFGGMLRHFSDAAIASFLPIFFLRSYPAFKA